MKISRHDKRALLELEIVALLLVIILGAIFRYFLLTLSFYLIVLLIGFVLYFWMLYEEKIHKTGKKHAYFEHTSSYLILGQTALVLGLLFLLLLLSSGFGLSWLLLLATLFLVISVIMYSVSLARILLYKEMFKR